MPGWVKHKLELRLPGEISITTDMQMTPPFWQKVKGTKKPLDKRKRGAHQGKNVNFLLDMLQ